MQLLDTWLECRKSYSLSVHTTQICLIYGLWDTTVPRKSLQVNTDDNAGKLSITPRNTTIDITRMHQHLLATSSCRRSTGVSTNQGESLHGSVTQTIKVHWTSSTGMAQLTYFRVSHWHLTGIGQCLPLTSDDLRWWRSPSPMWMPPSTGASSLGGHSSSTFSAKRLVNTLRNAKRLVNVVGTCTGLGFQPNEAENGSFCSGSSLILRGLGSSTSLKWMCCGLISLCCSGLFVEGSGRKFGRDHPWCCVLPGRSRSQLEIQPYRWCLWSNGFRPIQSTQCCGHWPCLR